MTISLDKMFFFFFNKRKDIQKALQEEQLAVATIFIFIFLKGRRWPDWKMLVSNNSFVPPFFISYFLQGKKVFPDWKKSGQKACSPNHSQVTGPSWALPGNKLPICFQWKGKSPHLENLGLGWFFFFLPLWIEKATELAD